MTEGSDGPFQAGEVDIRLAKGIWINFTNEGTRFLALRGCPI